MPASLEITIPTTSTSTTSPPYTIYTINLTTPLRTTHLQKRYSDFPILHNTLLSQIPHNTTPPAQLPSKSWSLFRSPTSSPQQIEERRAGLEKYLQAIQYSPDAKWRNTPAFRAFLGLPAQPRAKSPSSGKNASSQNGSTKHARADVTIDPNVWLDVHRDTKSALRSARLATTSRDQAPNAQAQHEAASEAKRCLVRAGTMIGALDAGLSGLAGGNAEESGRKLGDGEVRRRRDLVAGLRKERDAIEEALSATVTRAGQQGATQAGAVSTGARDTLLGTTSHNIDGTPHAPSNTSTTRRVIGSRSNTATETPKTRELDNNGVLALQQEVMQEQDADVSELTRTVARLRDMGVKIGEEVELQNEMLGIVEGDVERVGDKVRTARGRVAKIK